MKASTSPKLPPNPVIAYTRKSTEEDTRQVASHERQRDQITEFCTRRGERVLQWFEDSQSGKNFQRPDFQRMVAFCEAHPQPQSAPGTIFCLDYDRFGRPVDEKYRIDLMEHHRWMLRLHDAGWEVDFVLTPKSGNRMLDGLTGQLKAISSSEYIEKLSYNSREGKRRNALRGMWNGGPPPFPAARYDVLTNRRLTRGERANNGASILGPDPDHPEWREYWEKAARYVLSGGSLDGAGEMFAEWDIPQFYSASNFKSGRSRGHGWRHANMRKVLTNVALVGKLEVTDDSGTALVEARWEPLVDETLFWAVRNELERRSKGNARAPRDRTYVLDSLYCYDCGAKYGAATFQAKGKRRRSYSHPVPANRMNDVQAQRTKKAGCRHWYVDADLIEGVVRDLVLTTRTTSEFYDSLSALMQEQDSMQDHAARQEKLEKGRLADLQAQKANVKRGLRAAQTDAEAEEIMAEVRAISEEIEKQQAVVEQALFRSRSVEDIRSDLLAHVNESQAIAGAWDQPGAEGIEARRRLVTLWVARIWVEVIPVEGKPRSSRKRLHIALRTAPNTVLVRELTQQPEGSISSEMSPSGYYLSNAERVTFELTPNGKYGVDVARVVP